MASLRKHPKSRYWIACFTDHSGKQRQKSTKSTDRSSALKIAQGWEDAYRRSKTEIQLREAYSQISKEIHGHGLGFDTTEQFLRGWLSNKKVERKASSYVKYEGVVDRFLTSLGGKASKDLVLLSSSDLTNYRNETAQRLRAKTVNSHLKIIRLALEDAVRDGKISLNPAKQVRTLKSTGGTPRRPFTLDELQKVLDVANGEWKGLILAGVCTGQRLGDIARLRWSNVDMQKRLISLQTRKTGANVAIYILDPLWEYLSSEAVSDDDPEAPLFPRSFQLVEKADSVHPLSKQFHHLLVTAKLAKEWLFKKTGTGRSVQRDTSGLTFHSLRHTATSFLKRAGVPETVAMAIIGHSSRVVSQNYTHMDEATITKWMKAAGEDSFASIKA